MISYRVHFLLCCMTFPKMLPQGKLAFLNQRLQNEGKIQITKFRHRILLKCGCWFYFILFFKINLFIYLFLAAFGLHCCAWAFSSCGERGATLHCGAQASHWGGLSCRGAWALGARGGVDFKIRKIHIKIWIASFFCKIHTSDQTGLHSHMARQALLCPLDETCLLLNTVSITSCYLPAWSPRVRCYLPFLLSLYFFKAETFNLCEAEPASCILYSCIFLFFHY